MAVEHRRGTPPRSYAQLAADSEERCNPDEQLTQLRQVAMFIDGAARAVVDVADISMTFVIVVSLPAALRSLVQPSGSDRLARYSTSA